MKGFTHKISTTGKISCNFNFGERVAKDPRKTCQGKLPHPNHPNLSFWKKHDHHWEGESFAKVLRKGGSWKPVFSRTFINQLLLATVNTAIGLHQVCQWMQKLKELQPYQKQQRLARLRWCRCSWNERLPDFIVFFFWGGFWLCVVWGCCWNFNQVTGWLLISLAKGWEGSRSLTYL